MTSHTNSDAASQATFSVQPIRPDDAQDLARTMMSAFYQDPLWQTLWFQDMTLDNIIDGTTARLAWNMVKSDPLRKRFQKVIKTSSGRVVGYARWCLPASHASLHTWPAAVPPQATDEERSIYQEQFRSATDDQGLVLGLKHHMQADLSGLIEEAESKIIEQNGDLMELEYLAVHPDCQRQGIGRLLLRQGLAVADELGVKAFIIAKNAGVRLYQAHGFQTVDVVSQDRPEYGWNSSHVTTFLLREPGSR